MGGRAPPDLDSVPSKRHPIVVGRPARAQKRNAEGVP